MCVFFPSGPRGFLSIELGKIVYFPCAVEKLPMGRVTLTYTWIFYWGVGSGTPHPCISLRVHCT